MDFGEAHNDVGLIQEESHVVFSGAHRDAMGHKKANGERVGTIPFGFRLAEDGSSLEEDPAVQDVLRRMRELNRQGYTTRRGTAWRFQYVAAALKAAA
jgi:hypothetical protein